MPYPSKIDREAILDAARQIIEQEGLDKLSLRLLAEEHLGVTAPSLYRYFRGKQALLRALAEQTVERLFTTLYAAADTDARPTERAVSIAHAYRQFASANPIAYQLVYIQPDPNLVLDNEWLVQKVLPLQKLIVPLSGQDESLVALRGLLAILHGWVMLELANQLRRGGNLDQHYEQAVRTYLAGLQAS